MFLTPLVLRHVGGRYPWQVHEPLAYMSVLGQITVPRNFQTDLTSTPRAFWWLLPPSGEYVKAAVLHDYLYVTQPYQRRTCDRLFKHALKETGVSPWARFLLYWGVRLGGRRGWNRLGALRLADATELQ